MSIVENRIKTSIFLALLMILTPVAAASTVTSFSNGSSEVVIEFKDGVNTVNTTDGGFYIQGNQTITSASMNISTESMTFSSDYRKGAESKNPIWNPILNNGATSFSDISQFIFEDPNDNSPLPVSLSSEGYITDFESSNQSFLNTTGFSPQHPTDNKIVAWEYNQKDSKVITAGPDNCNSGDMCWGTNFDDNNYVDDTLDSNGAKYPYAWTLDTPAIYLDSNLNDTYLRFSSWHSLRTDYTSNGDLTYPDCAYMMIRSSSSSNFGNTGFSFLPVFVPFTTGVSPNDGLFVRMNENQPVEKISNTCNGIPSNQYGLAGTSTTFSNPNGWSEIAAQLAPYLGTYVQIRLIMESSDSPNSMYPNDRSGWYIDDFRIGESYAQNEFFTIKNVQPPSSYGEKQPNGYGVLDLDIFTPGESKLVVNIFDSVTQAPIMLANGYTYENIDTDVIELWDVDIDTHPFIDIILSFESGPGRISTPIFYGYNLGTSINLTFNDLNNYRDIDRTNDNKLNYSANHNLVLDSIEHLADFSNPIAGFTINGLDSSCVMDIVLNSNTIDNDVSVPVGSNIVLENPLFRFELNFEFLSFCVVDYININFDFVHYSNNVVVDILDDGISDWEMTQPAFGMHGRQNKLWEIEFQGISQAKDNEMMILDNVTGTSTGSFFLLPRNANVSYFNLDITGNNIYSTVDNSKSFNIKLLIGSQKLDLGTLDNEVDMTLMSELGPDKLLSAINTALLDNNTSIFKTDDFGIDWVRFGLELVQPNSNNGGSMRVSNLEVIYSHNFTMDYSTGFESVLREYVATNLQQNPSSTQLFVPVNVSSLSGGSVKLSNLSISSAPGYSSTLEWLSDSEGLYPNGQIYEVITTHEVEQSTGSSLAGARLRFTANSETFFLTYDVVTSALGKLDDDINRITLLPSTTINNYGSEGGVEILWKFTVNGNWDDVVQVNMFAESIASNGVIATLGGKILSPSIGNAVENDAGITQFAIYNTAGVEQQLGAVNTNQEITIVGQIRLEDLNESPDPNTYFLILEQKNLDFDGENVTVSWTQVANRSGVIAGELQWSINLGMFASGDESFRFRMVGYSNGDSLCPPSNYTPDADCGIEFDVSIDILDPNLIGIQLYRRAFGQGDPSLDTNWRTIYDDSWAIPRENQTFRIIASDIPTPPATALLHVWVEYDHDDNSNGIAEAEEYIQISTTSDGNSPNASYSGVYNDYANFGQNGRVSLWVECYDLAGNPIDGGSPGVGNDIITYISMQSQYPSISNMYIEDSQGERFLANVPVNPGEGIGSWNQTMFAGNEYHLIIEAQDGNGWRDVDYVEVEMAPLQSGYDSTIIYYPRNQSIWTNSDVFSIPTKADGSTKAKIRDMDGNVLLSPFTPQFYIEVPIILDWGLPLSELYTPIFSIKDISNDPVTSDTSFRQSWRYEDNLRLDYRADFANDEMISPMFIDSFEPYAGDVRKGSVYAGDEVLFSGQYSFTEGMSRGVFINPEIPLTMEITRAEVFRDAQKGYVPVDAEITTHTFEGGAFEIPVKVPGFQNEYSYTFRLINLPNGAEDFTSSYCFGSTNYGCGQFTIRVDSESPKAETNTWLAERGGLSDDDDSRYLLDKMPTSTYHCVDVEVLINEKGSLFEEDVNLKWKYYFGDPSNGITWTTFQTTFGSEPLSIGLDLTPVGIGLNKASKDCVDLWPIGEGQFDVREVDVTGKDVSLVMWIDAVDGSGTPIENGGNELDNGGAYGIQSNDPKHRSNYTLEFESAKFEVRNLRITPESPQIGDEIKVEVELINIGSLSGQADLELKSVVNNQPPVFESYIVSEEIGIGQSLWVSIKLEEFSDATTGMYYIVYDNESGNVLFNGDDEGKTFNVQVSSDDDSGFSSALIVIILVGVIAVLAIVVVVISRRGGAIDFDEFEFEDDDKEYASIPQTQGYSAPAAQVTPQMAEAMEKFTFWTQDEIQGYFDQGWDIQALEEWLESQ